MPAAQSRNARSPSRSVITTSWCSEWIERADPARERRLVVAAVLEAQAERGERPAPGARREHGHEAGVDPAREEDAERDFGRHARGDRAHERVTRPGDAGIPGVAEGSRATPVAGARTSASHGRQ
jgi:hypothetical protein